MEKLLEVENLSVSYFTYAGEVQSVRGISFDVKKGKTTALVGESGCGKSVTAKSLMGLIEKPGKVKPESKIIYQGKELTRVYGKRVEYLPWKRMLDGFPGCTGILKSDDEGWKADCRKSEESRE